jgi:adenosine deaminase
MNQRPQRVSVNEIPWPREVTELHVHLGGSVPLSRLWEIALDRGIRGIGVGYEDFVGMLDLRESLPDLDSYLNVFDKIELIQSGPAAVRESVITAVHHAYSRGGMVYAHGQRGISDVPSSLFALRRLELRWNPLKRTGTVFLKGSHAGLYDLDRIIKSSLDAVDEVESALKHRIQVGHILCFGRDMTFEANRALARKIRLWRERSPKIIGIDLAGHESLNPLCSPRQLEEMRIVFDEAGPKLGRTIHLGETPHVDMRTFVNTIEALQPTRLSHPIEAVRALREQRNDRGLKIMAERGIVCELNVRSSILTGAVSEIKEYRTILDTFDRYGIRYTFSTDAPSLLDTTLAQELILLVQSGAAGCDQILLALRTADDASFLPKRAPGNQGKSPPYYESGS